METFSALLAICAGNSPVPGEFSAQRPVTRSFDVFFNLHPNKLLSKQGWGWWFETPSFPLWRHRNNAKMIHTTDALWCFVVVCFGSFYSCHLAYFTDTEAITRLLWCLWNNSAPEYPKHDYATMVKQNTTKLSASLMGILYNVTKVALLWWQYHRLYWQAIMVACAVI